MVHFLIILALSIGLIAALGGWSRDRRLLSESSKRSQDPDTEGISALEKANKDLKASQADLQRRWQYLAEAQRLSHSGTFGWKVHTGELVWSDETYRLSGFARETHPTLDLVFDRVHPEDRDGLQQLRDRATQNGMDLDIEHRVLADMQALVRANDYKIDDTIEHLRTATENLDELTDSVKQRPWSLVRIKQPEDRKVPK
jgi:hypothetical protein